MPEEVKFQKNELDKVKEFQDEYVKIQSEFGQIALIKIRLEQEAKDLNKRNDELKEKLNAVQEKERKFIDEINKKYGEGVLDPTTGVFTPN